jgi:ribose transport system permease protein
MSTTIQTDPSLLDRVSKVKWSNYVVYIGFVLVFVFFATTQTEYFLNATNLMNIVIQAAPITIMAIGMVFVLSTGEIDLSIGSTVALSALTAAVTLQATDQWWIAAVAGLGTKALIPTRLNSSAGSRK